MSISFFELESLRMECGSLHFEPAPLTILRTTELESLTIPFAHVSGFFAARTLSFFFSFLSKYLCTSVSLHLLCQQEKPGGNESQITLAVIQPAGFDIILSHRTLSSDENTQRSAL